MKLPAIAVALAFLASMSATGCTVRTSTSGHAMSGHPASHRHDHCHERGGKHNKRKCHSHPHGPAHH